MLRGYSDEWIKGRLDSGDFCSAQDYEKRSFIEKYPELLDKYFIWGKSPCGCDVFSNEIICYYDLLDFMPEYSQTYGGMGQCNFRCDSCAQEYKLRDIKDYVGPEYPDMPEHQKGVAIANSSNYFVV